jgi:hypothetical protein
LPRKESDGVALGWRFPLRYKEPTYREDVWLLTSSDQNPFDMHLHVAHAEVLCRVA